VFAAVGYSEEDWQGAYIVGSATNAPPAEQAHGTKPVPWLPAFPKSSSGVVNGT
jgi:hypothetical protein